MAWAMLAASVLPSVIGLGMQAIGNHQTKERIDELSKKASADNSAVLRQFSNSTGLTGNLGQAVGNQEGVPNGQFPPGYGNL